MLTEAKTREVLQLQSTVQEKERDLQEKDRTIQTSEQLVAQFQKTLVEKDRVISDLQQTISAQNQPTSGKMGKTATATVAEKDISKLRWKDGKKAPARMIRGSTVVDGNIVYIKHRSDSLKIYSCQITSQDLQWSTLPDTEYYNPSLAVIDCILTTVGGSKYSQYTSGHLLAIGGRDDSGRDTADIHCYDTHTDSWQVVSEMKNKRCGCLAAVLPEDCLLVVGGWCGSMVLDSVEIGSLQ